MRKVWIVVANSTNAAIYRAENVNTLVQHHTLVHGAGHLGDRDLISDSRGRSAQKGAHGTDTLEEKTTPKAKESSAFAIEIAQYLESACSSGEFERLYVIAKSPFLGYLRQSLHPSVVKCVESEIQKDLLYLKPTEIREYLPPVL